MDCFDYLIGAEIESINRLCNLIKVDFLKEEKRFCLHIQTALFRGIKNEEVVFASDDIYLPNENYKKKLFHRFRWDKPGFSLFDFQLDKNKNSFINKKVVTAKHDDKDLIVKLENNCRLEVFSRTLEKEIEVFRIFEKGNLESHYVLER